MAKVPAKKTAKESPSPARKTVAKKKEDATSPIEKASIAVLAKLKELGLDARLQADIDWCLGSYSFDKNPIGLYETGARAIQLLKEEQIKKTKGVTAKLIADLEKAINSK